MKIVVPYSPNCKAVEYVRISLDQENFTPEYIIMNKEDSYHNLLNRLWEQGDPFIINEHDIIAYPGAIAKLESCNLPWCTHMYRCIAGWIGNGLGLVKFNPKQLPNIFQSPFENKHWEYLDTRISSRLCAHQQLPHIHSPAVTNLNPKVELTPTRCDMICLSPNVPVFYNRC